MAGILNWEFGDPSPNENTNSPVHKYANTVANKTVKVWKGSALGAGNITQIQMESDDIVGILDISSLSNLGGSLQLDHNPVLTKVINPVSSQVFSNYWVYVDLGAPSALAGTMDLSGLSKLGGQIFLQNNSNLTNIINPSSSQLITAYAVSACNLSTFDASKLTGLGGAFYISSNPNLTSIKNPDSSQAFSAYEAYSCNLTGTLDVSGLTGLGGSFRVETNPLLTKILNPISSTTFNTYHAHNCDLTGTLDVSGLTGLGGYFAVDTNPKLFQILNPSIKSHIK